MEQWEAYGHEYYQHNPDVLTDAFQQEVVADIPKTQVPQILLTNLFDGVSSDIEKKRANRKKVIIALVVLALLPIPIAVISNIAEDIRLQKEWELEDDDRDGVINSEDDCLDSSSQFKANEGGCTQSQGGNPYSPIDLTVRSLNRDTTQQSWWLWEDNPNVAKGFDEAEGNIKLSDLRGKVVVLHLMHFGSVDWYHYSGEYGNAGPVCNLEPEYREDLSSLYHILNRYDDWNLSENPISGKSNIQVITIITGYSGYPYSHVSSTFSDSCTDNESHRGHPDNLFFWPISYGGSNAFVLEDGSTSDLEREFNVHEPIRRSGYGDLKQNALLVIDPQGYVVAREDYTDFEYDWNSFDSVVGNAVNGNTNDLRMPHYRNNDCNDDYCDDDDDAMDSGQFESGGIDSTIFFVGLFFLYYSLILIATLISVFIHPRLMARSAIKKAKVAENIGDTANAIAILKVYSQYYEKNTKLSDEYKRISDSVEIH